MVWDVMFGLMRGLESIFKLCLVTAFVFFSFSPFAVEAAFKEDGGYYVLDEIEVKAPGADRPDIAYLMNPIDYYVWAMQITPNSNMFTQAEYEDGSVASYANEILEVIAHEEAGTDADMIASDIEANKRYFATARKLFEIELNETAAGPFQKFVWDWYLEEIDYEVNHAKKVAEFKANKEQWIRDWIARKEFEDSHPVPGKLGYINGLDDDEKLGLHTHERKELKSRKIGEEDSNPRLTYGQFLWHNREMEAKFQQARTEWMERYWSSGQSPSEKRQAAAERAYAKSLAALETSPFFRPGVSEELEYVKSTKGEKNPYWYDVSRSYLQTLQLENDAEIAIREQSTIGWESYAIIDEPIESVLAAYLFRNGHPIEGMPKSGSATVYPNDDLFQYRRDQSWSREAYWGPNTLVNHTIKWQAKSTFVADLSDAYLLLLRGTAETGYLVVSQFLGPFCPASEGVEERHCETEMQSSFTILILKPNGPNQTLYKMSSRSVGQNQEVAKSNNPDQGVAGDTVDTILSFGSKLWNMASEVARREIGFNVENFATAHDNFLKQANMVTLGRAAIKNGTEVIHLDSVDGYYIKANQVQKFDSAERAIEAGFYPISKTQGIYLVDGQVVRLADERGSKPFRAQPYSSWNPKDLK